MPATETPPAASVRPADLKEACVEEAFRIIAEAGVEKLSLREVSRRLGVSHQAPYKHFPSRDHILAAVIARAFDDFARHLEDRPPSAGGFDDLRAMGEAYMAYALDNPLAYRLMFGTPLPDPDAHPAMTAKARRAFDLLRDRIATLPVRRPPGVPEDATADALFVWSALHGLAGILKADAVCEGGPAPMPREAAIARAFLRIGMALRPDAAG